LVCIEHNFGYTEREARLRAARQLKESKLEEIRANKELVRTKSDQPRGRGCLFEQLACA